MRDILPEGYKNGKYVGLILPAEKFAKLPETIEVDGYTLKKKSEFHVTIIHAKAVAEQIAGDDTKAIARIEVELQELLVEYLKENPIAFVEFLDDLRIATRGDRVSVLARCTMQNLEGYFDRVNKVYNLQLPVQPAHVSLYTLTGFAIGIDTPQEMESYKKIELPEVQSALV